MSDQPETQQPDPLAKPAATDPGQTLRRTIYWLLIALAVGNALGRIANVNSVDRQGLEKHRISQRLKSDTARYQEQGLTGDALDARVEERRAELEEKLRLVRPFLSSNDRSRWATVRSLVEHGTYAIDEVVSQPNWDTIDMVKHKDREGEPHLYSSKPPLLATLIAGEYWILHKLTGETLGTRPYMLGRIMLVTLNVIPLAIMLILLGRICDRLGTTEWGRLFVMAAAALGTFLSTFVVVLNNHLLAAVCVAIAMYAVVRIWFDGERRLRYFALAGFFAAFAVTNELPAAAFCGLVSLLVLWIAPRLTLLAYVPAAAIVTAAFFGTNYVAHNSWRPPYAHRSATDPDDNWYIYTFERNGRTIDSYWKNPNGIDRGESSRATYALHTLIGHHGVFSLTPVWLLTIVGLSLWIVGGDRQRCLLAGGVFALSAICLGFYLMRPEVDRNYGGMTSGFRWMFWFAPLWLITMLPAVDAMSRSRVWRAVALVLLILSVASASFPTWNPWTHPWFTRYMQWMGWVTFG